MVEGILLNNTTASSTPFFNDDGVLVVISKSSDVTTNTDTTSCSRDGGVTCKKKSLGTANINGSHTIFSYPNGNLINYLHTDDLSKLYTADNSSLVTTTTTLTNVPAGASFTFCLGLNNTLHCLIRVYVDPNMIFRHVWLNGTAWSDAVEIASFQYDHGGEYFSAHYGYLNAGPTGNIHFVLFSSPWSYWNDSGTVYYRKMNTDLSLDDTITVGNISNQSHFGSYCTVVENEDGTILCTFNGYTGDVLWGNPGQPIQLFFSNKHATNPFSGFTSINFNGKTTGNLTCDYAGNFYVFGSDDYYQTNKYYYKITVGSTGTLTFSDPVTVSSTMSSPVALYGYFPDNCRTLSVGACAISLSISSHLHTQFTEDAVLPEATPSLFCEDDKPINFYSQSTSGGGTNYLEDTDAVLAYKFDEVAESGIIEDSVGSNNATIINTFGTVTQGEDGKFGDSIKFESSSQTLYLRTNNAVTIDSNIVTFVFWTKGVFRNNYLQVGSTNSELTLFSNDGDEIGVCKYYGGDETLIVRMTDTTDISASYFTHWAIVIDKSTSIGTPHGFKLYKNAVLQSGLTRGGEDAHTNNDNFSFSQLVIGASGTSYIYTTIQYTDELAIFKRELSQAEILEIMTHGLIGTYGTSDKPLHFYSRETAGLPAYGPNLCTELSGLSVDTENPSYPKSNLIDGNNTTFWNSTYGDYSGIHWIKYEFATATVITQFTISGTMSGTPPAIYSFQGSNDDLNWNILFDDADKDYGPSGVVKLTWQFSNSTAYKYYRIYITASFNHLYVTQVYEIEMMSSTPTVADKPIHFYSAEL